MKPQILRLDSFLRLLEENEYDSVKDLFDDLKEEVYFDYCIRTFYNDMNYLIKNRVIEVVPNILDMRKKHIRLRS